MRLDANTELAQRLTLGRCNPSLLPSCPLSCAVEFDKIASVADVCWMESNTFLVRHGGEESLGLTAVSHGDPPNAVSCQGSRPQTCASRSPCLPARWPLLCQSPLLCTSFVACRLSPFLFPHAPYPRCSPTLPPVPLPEKEPRRLPGAARVPRHAGGALLRKPRRRRQRGAPAPRLHCPLEYARGHQQQRRACGHAAESGRRLVRLPRARQRLPGEIAGAGRRQRLCARPCAVPQQRHDRRGQDQGCHARGAAQPAASCAVVLRRALRLFRGEH